MKKKTVYTTPVKVFSIVVQLVRDPHDVLAEVFLVDNEVAVIVATLHPHKVFRLVIGVKVVEQADHTHFLLAGKVNTVHCKRRNESNILVRYILQTRNTLFRVF